MRPPNWLPLALSDALSVALALFQLAFSAAVSVVLFRLTAWQRRYEGLESKETGVEMYFDDSKELIDSFRDIAEDRDCCISFRWGGSMQECACAMVASYALADSFDAIVSYEGEAPPESIQAFRKETESVIAQAAKGR